MIRTTIAGAALALAATAASAQEVATYPYDGGVEDAAFELEQEIVGRGLVIDFASHVGDMLARTAADVGAEGSPVGAAQVFVFCSATVSRDAMEADPLNVAHCPYGVFVAEIDGATVIGHRTYVGTGMEPVNDLLSEIARAVTD